MNAEQERLSREIANEGANSLIEMYHMGLPIEARLTIHCRYFDAILAGIWVYHEVAGAQRIRALAMASEN